MVAKFSINNGVYVNYGGTGGYGGNGGRKSVNYGGKPKICKLRK